MTLTRPQRGHLVIGTLLIAMGAVLLLDRVGVTLWNGGFSLWPVILIAIGVIRFVDSPASGPYRGLFPILIGIWLMAVGSGWLSPVASWPVVLVGLGIIMAVNGMRASFSTRGSDSMGTSDHAGAEPSNFHRQWRREGRSSFMAIVGVWIIVLLALQTPRGWAATPGDGRHGTSIVALLGHPDVTRMSGAIHRASLLTVLGRSELDLRSTTIATGETLTLDVVALGGRGVVRVPHEWVVDLSTEPLAGTIVDERPAATRTTDAAAPHVRLTGVAAFGSLALRY